MEVYDCLSPSWRIFWKFVFSPEKMVPRRCNIHRIRDLPKAHHHIGCQCCHTLVDKAVWNKCNSRKGILNFETIPTLFDRNRPLDKMVPFYRNNWIWTLVFVFSLWRSNSAALIVCPLTDRLPVPISCTRFHWVNPWDLTVAINQRILIRKDRRKRCCWRKKYSKVSFQQITNSTDYVDRLSRLAWRCLYV